MRIAVTSDVHGNLTALEPVLADLEVYGPLEVPIAVYGHIHHAYIRELDGLTVVNAGSLSLALDGDVRATYAVIEQGRVDHRRVPYDVERVASEMLEIDYPNAARYANWLRTGAWT